MPSRSNAVLNPVLGVFKDRASLQIPKQGFSGALNVRVRNGKITNSDCGYGSAVDTTDNDGEALLFITNFSPSNATPITIAGTKRDLLALYDTGASAFSNLTDAGTPQWRYITPIYATGTAAASGTAVTGSGTSWSANVKVGDQIAFGSATQTLASATWYTVSAVGSDTSITLSASAGTVADGAYTIRKVFSGTIDDRWSHDMLILAQPANEDTWYATNNGKDYPVSWNGTAAQVTSLSSLALKCKCLRVWKNSMVYGGITKDAGDVKLTTIIMSNTATPTDVSTGTAVEEIAYSGTDPMFRLMEIGNSLVIYGNRTIAISQYVGADVILAFQTISTGVAPLAPGLIADNGVNHRFIAKDAMYQFDGANLFPVGTQFWRWVSKNIDQTRLNRAFVHFDEANGEILWAIPFSTDAGDFPEIAYAMDTLTPVPRGNDFPVWPRTFPFSCGSMDTKQKVVDPLYLVGNSTGSLYTWASGQPSSSYVTTRRMATQDGRVRGVVKRLYPFIATNASTNLTLTLYQFDSADGDSTGNASFTLSQGLAAGSYYFPVYRRARYVEFKFGVSDTTVWDLSGWDWDGLPGGSR